MTEEEVASSLVNRWGKKGYTWDSLAVEGDELVAIKETEQWNSEFSKKKSELIDKKRGLIRSLVLILDLSTNCLETRTFGQNRMTLIQEQSKEFISDFFVQNPLSQLAILGTFESTCKILSNLSSNSEEHLNVIRNLSSSEHKGEASVEASLSVASAILGLNGIGGVANISSTKEVLMIYGALNTCDTDPIFKTIEKIKESSIRVSIVGLGAKVNILEKIAEATKGDYFVPVSGEHLVDIMHSFLIPPERLTNQKSFLIPFGFAAISESKKPAFDLFGFLSNPPSAESPLDYPKYGGYICPKCHSRVFQIPCFCPVCRDFLIAPAYLKRTACHLKPIPPFEVQPAPLDAFCTSCNRQLKDQVKVCTQCGKCFCETCDKFIHENLQSCPGCMESKPSV